MPGIFYEYSGSEVILQVGMYKLSTQRRIHRGAEGAPAPPNYMKSMGAPLQFPAIVEREEEERRRKKKRKGRKRRKKGKTSPPPIFSF